jgi:hypothetical protein
MYHQPVHQQTNKKYEPVHLLDEEPPFGAQTHLRVQIFQHPVLDERVQCVAAVDAADYRVRRTIMCKEEDEEGGEDIMHKHIYT